MTAILTNFAFTPYIDRTGDFGETNSDKFTGHSTTYAAEQTIDQTRVGVIIYTAKYCKLFFQTLHQ
jgi:hypothetical protein